MIIRPVTEDDAEDLLKMNELFNGKDISALDNIKNHLASNPSEMTLIAFVGEDAAGFICGQIFKSWCYHDSYAEITELFVKEPYRRLGVARALIANLEKLFQSQGINHFQLFTGKENKKAQALYENTGYKSTSEIMYRKHLK